MEEGNKYQILIRLLNGKHKTLTYPSPTLPLSTLKHQIHSLTSIPPPLQLLLLPNSKTLDDSPSLTLPPPDSFPLIIHLLLRLRGGKGGFGSLLRGAATKAGQKKTNNFDACRDMSGRRLRHVNAEKRLEEWRAEEGERRLEKVAEEWVSKKEKEAGRKRKNSKGEDAERYVAKYREQSEKCREDVERSVRESLKGVLASKRKIETQDVEAKRRKIRMGKRIADSDSDSDDMDNDIEDDDDEENEKSAVIDNGSNSDSAKEANRSPDSITGTQLNSVSSEIVTSDSGTETEKHAGPEENRSPAQSTDDDDNATPSLDVPSLDASVASGSVSRAQENVIVDKLNNAQATIEKEFSPVDLGQDLVALSHPKSACTETEPGKPLNFNDYKSAAEMEVLGMERLKLELQERGMKCGGTLQERAARLFLLKTTPLEKLPKKLFAKK